MVQERQHRRNYNDPGHAHELTFSCYKGFKFLRAERTCEWLAEAIEEARVRLNFDLWAYVFMPEHVHLIVRPREAEYDIANIRKAIKAPVGRKAIRYLLENAQDWMPRVTRQRGKKTERLFWQSGGGYDRNVIKTKTLMNMIDYIHMNPCGAGSVRNQKNGSGPAQHGTSVVERYRFVSSRSSRVAERFAVSVADFPGVRVVVQLGARCARPQPPS